RPDADLFDGIDVEQLVRAYLQRLGQKAARDQPAAIDFQHLGDGANAAAEVLDRRRVYIRAGARLQIGRVKTKRPTDIEGAVGRQFAVLRPLGIAREEQEGACGIALGT